MCVFAFSLHTTTLPPPEAASASKQWASDRAPPAMKAADRGLGDGLERLCVGRVAQWSRTFSKRARAAHGTFGLIQRPRHEASALPAAAVIPTSPGEGAEGGEARRGATACLLLRCTFENDVSEYSHY